jgi:hypothetical protein
MSETEQETPQPAVAPAEEQDEEKEPDEEEAEETTPEEPQAGAEVVLSEKQMEKALAKLDAEALRHRNRVSEIMGDDALSLIPCELCAPNIAGFRFNVAPSYETIAAVRQAIGLPSMETLKQDRYSRRCDNCDGAGRVKTDSRVQGQEHVPCYDCKGRGWIPIGPERQTPQPQEGADNGAPIGVVVADDGLKRDMFGTPESDPDYGLMPNMRQRPIDYWQTHA